MEQLGFLQPEVLAPAGDEERLKAALQYGADAVYLGGQIFGMRASGANFGPDKLRKAVEMAHQKKVKVYLTCNTIPTNTEVEELRDFLLEAQAAGVDALIVADIGILMLAKRVIPDMPIHISTQTGIVNYLTATELYHLGASRVVLARELSLDEIKTIRDKTPPELGIEVFAHGAMCVSFSGRCLLSQYLTARDANRGECAQPCRWGYYLMEEKRPGQYFKIFEDERGSYILNAKDLCLIEEIPKLIDAGVSSLKIEGRVKSFYYVAVVTNAYRCAVDWVMKHPGEPLPSWIEAETRKVSHRQYSKGFLFGKPENGQFYENGGYIRSYDVVAVVEDWKNGTLYCHQRNKFWDGDRVEVLVPGQPPVSLTVTQLADREGQRIEAASHPMMEVSMASAIQFPKGSLLRKKVE